MQCEIIPEDRLIQPLCGEGGLTRDQARAEVQSILDRSAALSPEFEQVAQRWRGGGVKDDTLYLGPFIWTIYEHDPGEPLVAAQAWMEDMAATMRTTGIDVQVGQFPDR